jgi:hypothetical protein
MIVVVDANVIVGDPDLGSDVWQQLSAAVKTRGVRVFVPELALEESIATQKQKIRSMGKKLLESVRYAPAAVKSSAKHAQSEFTRVASEYEMALRNRWAELGFEVMQTPNTPHVDVALRAIRRERPFNQQGGGYRDTLHWLALLEVAQELPYEHVTLLSGDGIFSVNEKIAQQLNDEFQTRSKATVTLCRKLSDLEVPGHYASEPVDAPEYAASVEERLKQYLGEEDALRRMRTAGITVPYSDWDDLVGVANLELTSLTSRDVEQQSHPELRFRAQASFTVRGSYIHDRGDEVPELSTQDIELEIEIAGATTALSDLEVGTLRNVEAVLVGDDPHLADEVARAGSQGLSPSRRRELVSVFGQAAVAREEARQAGSS